LPVTYATAHLEGKLADLDGWVPRNCSIGRALDVIGTRSALLILREAFYGVKRFDDFVRRLEMTEAVISARLRELVDVGVLEKVPYREPGQRARSEYALTQMGLDLLPSLLALMRWGDTYLADRGGPIALNHLGCGAPVEVRVVCDEGHDVGLGELTMSSRSRQARP
jgi:DNA-binding HxlR family transcriptional regulator